MLNTKVMISVVCTLGLMGCGGGDDDSQSPSVSSDSSHEDEVSSVSVEVVEELSATTAKVYAVNVEEVHVEPPAEATVNMSELKASEDFSFTSKQHIEVILDISDELALSGQTGLRAYVSVYSDYTLLSNGQFYADSSSRVLAGDLDNGHFDSSFVNLKSQSAYLIEVWFYNGDDPLQKELQIVDNSLIW